MSEMQLFAIQQLYLKATGDNLILSTCSIQVGTQAEMHPDALRLKEPGPPAHLDFRLLIARR